MKNWLQLNPIQRLKLIADTSVNSGLNFKAIEKDWWVTLSLNALFKTNYAQHFIFKGGTSLSKCWNLIERFSEDIDIGLSPEAFGERYEPAPSHNYVKILKRKGCEFTSNVLKPALENEFTNLGVPANAFTIFADGVPADRPDKDPQTLLIRFSSVVDEDPYLTDVIRIEFSVRSMKEPYALITIQSLLSRHTSLKENPFEVIAAAPSKTLLEKMFLLHERFQREHHRDSNGHRLSRHLYDIAALVRSPAGESILNDHQFYLQLLQHRKHYVRYPGLDYETLISGGLRFIPPIELHDAFRKDYTIMHKTMIYGKPLPFNSMLDQLKAYAERLTFPTREIL